MTETSCQLTTQHSLQPNLYSFDCHYRICSLVCCLLSCTRICSRKTHSIISARNHHFRLSRTSTRMQPNSCCVHMGSANPISRWRFTMVLPIPQGNSTYHFLPHSFTIIPLVDALLETDKGRSTCILVPSERLPVSVHFLTFIVDVQKSRDDSYSLDVSCETDYAKTMFRKGSV
jgi:hypothetical protein